MITKSAHQGDIYLKRVAKLPKHVEEISKDNGKTVIAYGEQTGHHHAFIADNVRLLAANDNKKQGGVANDSHNQSRRFVVISDYPATLFHEEHGQEEFAPGTYEIFRAREWTDEDDGPATRPVRD